MSYNIKTGKPKSSDSAVNLDRFIHLKVPDSIRVGLVNRGLKYKDWLELSLESNGDDALGERLQSLAFIHRMIAEKGEICLFASGSLADIQIKGVKEFLMEHRVFIDSILPYIFSDVVNITEKDRKVSYTN